MANLEIGIALKNHLGITPNDKAPFVCAVLDPSNGDILQTFHSQSESMYLAGGSSPVPIGSENYLAGLQLPPGYSELTVIVVAYLLDKTTGVGAIEVTI